MGSRHDTTESDSDDYRLPPPSSSSSPPIKQETWPETESSEASGASTATSWEHVVVRLRRDSSHPIRPRNVPPLRNIPLENQENESDKSQGSMGLSLDDLSEPQESTSEGAMSGTGMQMDTAPNGTAGNKTTQELREERAAEAGESSQAQNKKRAPEEASKESKRQKGNES